MAGVGTEYLRKNANDNFGGWFFLLLAFLATTSPQAAIYKQEKNRREKKCRCLDAPSHDVVRKECILQKIKNYHSDNGARKMTLAFPKVCCCLTSIERFFSGTSMCERWRKLMVAIEEILTDMKKEKKTDKIKKEVFRSSTLHINLALPWFLFFFFVCYRKPVSSLVVICSHPSQTTQELKHPSAQLR